MKGIAKIVAHFEEHTDISSIEHTSHKTQTKQNKNTTKLINVLIL